MRLPALRPLLLFAALAPCASTADLVIDAAGARPRQFRLSLANLGELADDGVDVDLFRTSWTGRSRRLRCVAAPLLFIGEQDGRRVLVEDVGRDRPDYRIIGDASDPDRARPLGAVRLVGLRGSFENSDGYLVPGAWKVASNAAQLPDLPRFTGQPWNFHRLRDLLLAEAASGGALSPADVQVMTSALFPLWSRYRQRISDAEVPAWKQRARDLLLAPLAEAARSTASPRGRRLLAALAETARQGARERLRYFREYAWARPMNRVLTWIMDELDRTRRQLERPQGAGVGA